MTKKRKRKIKYEDLPVATKETKKKATAVIIGYGTDNEERYEVDWRMNNEESRS